MSHKPQISVVIPTYNRVEVLRECLHFLGDQTLDSDFYEVIVCDDGSTDATPEVLRTLSTPYKLTSIQQSNAGPSAARNKAILSARAPIILIINDDTFVEPNTLELHLRRQLEYQGEKVSVLGTSKVNPQRIGDYFTNLVDQMHLVLCHHALGEEMRVSTFRHFFTCNISLERQALLDVGLFDESFFKGCEDVEIGYRLQQLGWKVLYDPSIQSAHHHRHTPESFADMTTARAMGHILIWEKHPEIADMSLGSSTLNGAIYERTLKHGQERVSQELETLIQAELQQIKRLLFTIHKQRPTDFESQQQLEVPLKKHTRSLHLYCTFYGRMQSPYFSQVAATANPELLGTAPKRKAV